MDEPRQPPTPRASRALAVLVVGIAVNTIGVVLVSLRGLSWAGLPMMVIGIGMLLYAVVVLTAEAKGRSPRVRR